MQTDLVLVGTCGWQFRHWSGLFYPQGMDDGQWLNHYATEFGCVEIQQSFYDLPEHFQLQRWRQQVPADFEFSVFAPRVITHTKKLKNAHAETQKLFTRLDGLGDQVGPVVFQLPSKWRCNMRRLIAFVDGLPLNFRYVFEMEHPSWHAPEVNELLKSNNIARCLDDDDIRVLRLKTTADFVYVRLRGSRADRSGQYHANSLRAWVNRTLTWLNAGKKVYITFVDDQRTNSIRNARRLQNFIAEGLS